MQGSLCAHSFWILGVMAQQYSSVACSCEACWVQSCMSEKLGLVSRHSHQGSEKGTGNRQNSNEGTTHKAFPGVWPSPVVVLEYVAVDRGQIMKDCLVKSHVFSVDL